MGSTNELSNLEPFTYTGSYMPFPPSSFLDDSSSQVELNGSLKSSEGTSYHQRCSSESFLIEEQPSWLDDLLNETDTVFHRGHRRSASDSYAYFGETAETFGLREESNYVNALVDGTSNETNADLLGQKTTQELEEVVSSLSLEKSRDEYSLTNHEDSADRATGSQVKPSGSKADSKRSKQHNAHRSRVRKLQYIAHLERTVQILKAEGSDVSAELEFLEQQNIILTMENRALRQRLESISQEQIIKHWEQGMLEREIGRLQNLYHLQKQQQMQLHNQQQQQQQPQNQHLKHRRNKSRDFDHQINNAPMRNKDASSSKSPPNGSFRV